jgi:cell wall-associated NlpC family hydrolase
MTSRRLLFVLPTMLALLLLVPVAASAGTSFQDTAGTFHENAVGALVEEGIVEGCGDRLFCSGDVLTRGQVATLLVRALDLPPAERERFGDTADSAHGRSAEALAEAGLVNGCRDDAFCTSTPINRAQLASMLYRAFDVADAPTGVTYFDDVGGVHEPAVRALAAAGITAGCSDRLTSFCAGDNVQRSHAAVFLARTLDLVDRAQIAPFAERKAAQDKIDAEAAAEAEAQRIAAEKEREQREAEAALASVKSPGQTAVEIAVAQLGKPYRWGGSGPNSFDCSGLTSYAWAQAGVTVPRTSGAQYAGTTRISRSELRPGDLVFYHSPISHVAMYIGDGRVVEAPNSGNNVRIRTDGLTRRGVVGFGRP